MNTNFSVSNNKFGKCLIANVPFSKGDKLYEFNGTLLHELDVPDYSGSTQFEDRYLQVDKDYYRETKDGTCDYMNHSCNPTCAVLVKDREATLYAIKDINVGDEITFDYSIQMYNEPGFEIICQCGSYNCRTVINEYTYLPRDVKKYYLDLGYVPEYNLYL